MQQTNKSKKPPLRRAASARPCNDCGGVHVWCMCSVVKGLRRARSTPDDLLLSGATTLCIQTVSMSEFPTQQEPFVVWPPTQQSRNSVWPAIFFKSEDHSVVPTGQRAINTAIHRAQAPLILASLGRSCLCQRFLGRNGYL